MNSYSFRDASNGSSQVSGFAVLSPFFALAALIAVLPGLAIWLAVGAVLIAGLVISDLIRYLSRRLAARPSGALVSRTSET